jgi:hypothetical protein
MTEATTLTGQLIQHLETCPNREEATQAHADALHGAQGADMLVEAFRSGDRALYMLALGLMQAVPESAEKVIDALVTCVARADRMFELALEHRDRMEEVDPALVNKVRQLAGEL